MTKLFIIIGAALGVRLMAGLVLSLIAPNKISVRRTSFISASNLIPGLTDKIAATNQQGLDLLKQVAEQTHATPLTTR
ncbi:MAG: hypothetical protein SF053_14290 [Bacteroidia bacterium]|nr:hypothetical protein [Bacteroidia bacterium]